MSQPKAGVTAKAAATVQEIYRPILRGYFAAFVLYFVVKVPTIIMHYHGLAKLLLVAASLIVIAIGICGIHTLRRKTAPKVVEALLLSLNICVVCNVILGLAIDLTTVKLTNFIIMAMAFSLGSTNFRQSALSCSFALSAMAYFLWQMGDVDYFNLALATFAAAVAGATVAYLLRKAITDIAVAKVEAEEHLEEAQAVGAELRKKSLSDSLTNLPNRRAFFNALRDAMRATLGVSSTLNNEHARAHCWLLLLDLDGFKAVNDVHGHLTGDRLLQEVALRLTQCAGDIAHASRIGGDEFNFVTNNPANEAEIEKLSEAWLAEISKPYDIEGRQIRISASIGCRRIERGLSSRTLISEADYALLIAKRQGKNRSVVFNDHHAMQAKVRSSIEKALRVAILEEEMTLVFQPQFDLRSQKIVRAEALARWDSPLIGKIEPQRFIKIAEESGLITGITMTVAEKAFAELSGWENPLPVSINLSSFDLMSDSTIEQLIHLAMQFEIRPSLVEFEVTETAMMADFEKANRNLRKLTKAGFTIALDDFGTGYSNFSYLRALPIKKLKVDRSFLENPGDPLTAKILTSLSGMSRVLDLECLIEGVEDEIDLLIAKRSGFSLIQGYYFGEPMAAPKLLDLVSRSPGSPMPDALAG